ncbi:TetR family transcriptional regulator [Flexivirga oryzae]|uniref:AcrR family transcriptional regulator n=1 Tax=Flexivirga oryzae TaxID=1794944 RepID=A0A839NE54_9MICO|nr:AcrR family transcriptional regulator [Flexivirga oryzae]
MKAERAGRAPLTPSGILRTGVAIADADGLAALSMRRLAKELEVTPMALYWHFADRDALLDAMAEQVTAEARFSDDSRAAWDRRYRAVLSTLVDLLRAHPWMGRLVIERLVPLPHYLAALEILLDSSDAAGIEVHDAVLLAQQSVQAMVTLVECEPTAPGDPATSLVELADLHTALDNLPDRDFPRIRAAASALTTPLDVGRYYRVGIDTVVAGVRAAAPIG